MLRSALLAVVLAAVLALTAAPAEAKDPRVDVTPGCVSISEYLYLIDHLERVRGVRRYLQQNGAAVLNDEVDMYGEPYNPRVVAERQFAGCGGALMTLVYQRWNGWWVYANYEEVYGPGVARRSDDDER